MDEKYTNLHSALEKALNSESVEVFLPSEHTYNATVYIFDEGFAHVFDSTATIEPTYDQELKQNMMRVTGRTDLREIKPACLEELAQEIYDTPKMVFLVGGPGTPKEKQEKGIFAYSEVLAKIVMDEQNRKSA